MIVFSVKFDKFRLKIKDLTTTGAFYTHALASSQRRAAQALPDCTKMVQNGVELTI